MALKPTLTGDGPTIVLEVADDLSADKPQDVQLRLRLEQWVKGDQVEVYWDGQLRPKLESRYHFDPTANPWERPSDVSHAVWLHSRLEVSQVARGPHEVKVVLKRRNPQVLSDLVLTNVELVILYR